MTVRKRPTIPDIDDPVDTEISPLLESLWNAGFGTRSSCAGGQKHPWDYGYILLEKPLRAGTRQSQEVRDIVERFTDVPFKVFKRGAIIFEGPLVEPYSLEELKGVEPKSPLYYPDKLWWENYGGRQIPSYRNDLLDQGLDDYIVEEKE